jgi:hypothetical protein
VTDAATRNSRNRRIGIKWEQTFCRLASDRTGLEVKRTLLETREGNLGDTTHDRMPLVHQIKTTEVGWPPLWPALEEAAAVADPISYFAVAVLEQRKGRGRSNLRVVGMYEDDFNEIAELVNHAGPSRGFCEVTKSATTGYPRVWDGFLEAVEKCHDPAHCVPTSIPICRGVRFGTEEEPLRNVVLMPLDAYMDWISKLVKAQVW